MMESAMFRLTTLLLFVAISMKCDGTKAKSSKITHDLQIETFGAKFRSALSYNVLNGLTGKMDYETVSASLAESLVPIGELLTNKSETNLRGITWLGVTLMENLLSIFDTNFWISSLLERNSVMHDYATNISFVVDTVLYGMADRLNCRACITESCSAVDLADLLRIIKRAFVFNCLNDGGRAGPAQHSSTTLRHPTTVSKPAGKLHYSLTDCLPSSILETQTTHRKDLVNLIQYYKNEFVKLQVAITLCKYSENGNATLEVARDISTEIATMVDFMISEINYRLDASWKKEAKNRLINFINNRTPGFFIPSSYRTLAYSLWMQVSSLGSFSSRYQILITRNNINGKHTYHQYMTCWKELDCLYISELSPYNIVVTRHFITDMKRTAEVSKYMYDYIDELAYSLKELMDQNVEIDHMPQALSKSLGWNSLLSAKLYHNLVLYSSSDDDECTIQAYGRYTNSESHWEISQIMNQPEKSCRKVKLFFLL